MLTQYIIVPEALFKEWGAGPMIAQACHAATACLATFAADENVKQYVGTELPAMHKVVLSVSNSMELQQLAAKLRESKIDHYLWHEQPENVPSALAIKPYKRPILKAHLGHLRLFPKELH